MLAYNEWTKVFLFYSQEETKRTDAENFLRQMGASEKTIFRCMADDPSREDINGIMVKYHCEDFEVLLQDRGSVEDKITLFLTCKGFGAPEDMFTWLDNNPLLLPTSLRALERGINHMLAMSILARHGEEISFQVLPSTRAVTLGRRVIASDVFGVFGEVHRAIKITDRANHPLNGRGTWSEVRRRGLSLLLDSDSTSLPLGFPDLGVNSNSETQGIQFLGYTSKTDCEIRLWRRQYLKKYPTYSGWNNCRSYALDFAAFLGTPVG